MQMPGKHAKNKGYIELSPDEWNIVTAQKVVEDYWFNNPKGWWDGPDGMGLHPTLGVEVPYLHCPGIRNAMVAAGVEEPYLPAADWLLAEYVHSSQMPRCVPTAINGFIELYFGSHYTLFGHQLGMYYSPQRYNIVVGGRGSGKCLVADTLVTMADGSRKRIQDVCPGDSVATLEEDALLMRTARVTHVMEQPAKPLNQIVTRSGRKLTASFDHPILTPYGWCEAGKIKVGDRVAQPIRLNRNITAEPAPRYQAILLGLLISEGGLAHNRCYFTNSNSVLIEAVMGALKEWSNDLELRSAGHWNNGLDYRVVDNAPGRYNRVLTWLRDIGLLGTSSYTKFVPEFVFQQSNEWIADFLGYLFAGDGCAYHRKCGGNKLRGSMEYSSASERLIRDVQDLLLVLGIHSKVRYKPIKFREHTYESWNLDIPYAHDRQCFVKTIYVPTKQEKFVEVASLADETNSSDDVVPLDLIREHCYSRASLIGKPFGKRVGNERPYSNMRPRYDATRPKLRRLAEFLDDDPLLLKYADSDIYWSTVVSNEELPPEPLYDLTVENDHNFVANGIVVHNTIPMAIMMMVWTALHPGEPWLHVALSLDQAKKAYNAILDMAARRHYRSDGTMTARSFAEVFIQDKREFPQTDIYFRPWDEHDGGEIAGKQQAGNTIMFRSLGDEDLERLRSTEAGEGSGDEILREVHDSKTVNHIRGCLRGLNPWLMAHLPQKHRQRINELQQMIGIGNVTGNDELVERCENELLDFKVGRMKRFYAIGNAGEPDWVWEVMDMAEEKPHYAWFIQVSMYDNIRLSPEDRAALEEAWGTDPEARQVELLGRRPLGLGTEIDPQLLMSAVRGERHGELSELGGRIIQEHPAHGIIHYVKLPTQGHFHVIAGDPGKDKLPRRNSWCVMVVDITANPAEVVFFQMGNLNARSKTYVPYTNAYKFAAQTYPVVSPADMIYDNGGQQSGMHEVLLGSLKEKSPTVDEELERDGFDVFGNPYDMTNSMKHTAANWLIDLLRKGALIMPELRILVRQTSNWSLPDKKIAQDSTMTLFMLVYRMYYIISDRSLGYGIEQEPSSPWSGDGNSGWQMPDDAGVLYNVSKESL
jgi:intein/homing endonuclease